MKIDFAEYEVRWSDLDPNSHMANYAYVQYCDETRVHFLRKSGLMGEILKANIGPIVLHEHFYYMNEVMPYEKIRVDVQLNGHAPDFKFVEFAHHMYNSQGEIAMFSKIMFGWMNLEKRKLALPTNSMIEAYQKLNKTEEFRIFESSETRAKGVPYGKKIESL